MTEIIEFDEFLQIGKDLKPFLNPFVPPASELRGITVGWRPKYVVILDGKLYTDQFEEIQDWCDEHCKGLRDWHIIMPNFYWGFDNKDDVIYFRMVWG